jgi:hypothetical protein
MPVSETAVYAADYMNPETLKKWYQEETREKLRIIIMQKMSELKIKPPKIIFLGSDDSGAK